MAKAKKGGVDWSNVRDLALFVFAIALIAGAYGYSAALHNWFPARQVEQAGVVIDKIKEELGWKLPWYYKKVGNLPAIKTYQAGKVAPGLVLVTGLGSENHPEARVIDSQGKVYQRWSIDWFQIWPNATHIAEQIRPKGAPGPNIHGVMIADNGDLVFNMDWAALIRMDACGHVRWKLPHMTHHSLFRDDDGNFWVPDLKMGKMHDPHFPGYVEGTYDYSVTKVSPDGKILKSWRIFDILLNNGLESYLYLSPQISEEAHMKGDTLHLNDVEVFPRSMTPGIFQPGDVMISLRNINMVLVFDPATGKVRHVFNGPFIHQHDPDFVDGNSITVFDNYSHTLDTPQQRSRIVQVYADGSPARILFEGNKTHPFFTDIMGKQQLLTNGDRLLTETVNGRALEIDAAGHPVWEYRNFVKPGVVGMLDEAQHLPLSMNAPFFERARKTCGAKS